MRIAFLITGKLKMGLDPDCLNFILRTELSTEMKSVFQQELLRAPASHDFSNPGQMFSLFKMILKTTF